jgi:hypothetical protein
MIELANMPASGIVDLYGAVPVVPLIEEALRRLLEGECQLPGEWDYISAFRHADTRPPPDEAVLRALRRRLLIVPATDGWRLRVPLMQRWLRQRG